MFTQVRYVVHKSEVKLNRLKGGCAQQCNKLSHNPRMNRRGFIYQT